MKSRVQSNEKDHFGKSRSRRSARAGVLSEYNLLSVRPIKMVEERS